MTKKLSKLNDFLNDEKTDKGLTTVCASVICALAGIILGFVILAIINPEHAPQAISSILLNFMYYDLGSLKQYYLGNTLVNAVPLILCAFSVLFTQKTGLFNIGVAGQYCIGISASLYCAIGLHLPWFVCVLAAIVCAALWAVFTGVFKVFFRVNEVIAGIMTNWIGLYLVNIILSKPNIMNTSQSETFSIRSVSPESLLPSMGLKNLFAENEFVSIAIPLTIIIAVIIYVLLTKTTFGYELQATGFNKDAALYAGMKEKRNVLISFAISGALAGLAAAFFFLTDIQTWKTTSVIPSMGFNGIAVAFLGGQNPFGAIIAGFFIQNILLGGGLVDMKYFNPEIAELIASIIIYVCAFVLFLRNVIGKMDSKKSEFKKVVE